MPIRFVLFCFVVLLSTNIVCGQTILAKHTADTNDSSYYDIEKINVNEFWAGGENGILTRIDSAGNPTPINLPGNHSNFLKILAVGHFVFLFTDDATIFRYNILNNTFIKKSFKQFKSKCFYDAIVSSNNEIIICGGATGISRHQKKIPSGFIAKTDLELNTPQIVWKSYRKFVWNLLPYNNAVLAITYNGNRSAVLLGQTLHHWKPFSKKVKGIVHEVVPINGDLFYAGTPSMHYKELGMMGAFNMSNTSNNFIEKQNKGGCIWTLKKCHDGIIGINQIGDLICIKKDFSTTRTFSLLPNKALYEIEKVSENKFILVGHGKTIILAEINEQLFLK